MSNELNDLKSKRIQNAERIRAEVDGQQLVYNITAAISQLGEIAIHLQRLTKDNKVLAQEDVASSMGKEEYLQYKLFLANELEIQKTRAMVLDKQIKHMYTKLDKLVPNAMASESVDNTQPVEDNLSEQEQRDLLTKKLLQKFDAESNSDGSEPTQQ